MPIDANGMTPNEFFVRFWSIFWNDAAPEFKLCVKICLVLSVFFLIFGKSIERRYIGMQNLLLVFGIFNHYTMMFLCRKFGLSSRYFRYTWIIPITIVIAYAASRLILYWDTKYTRVIACVVSIVALAIGGKFLCKSTKRLYTGVEYNSGMIPVDNVYKIEQDTYDVVSLIEEDKQNPTKLVKVSYGYEMMMDIRTYDASLYSGYSLADQNRFRDRAFSQDTVDGYILDEDYRSLMLFLVNANPWMNDPAPIIDDEIVDVTISNQRVSYAIVRNNGPYAEQLIKCGILLGETDNYYVIKY